MIRIFLDEKNPSFFPKPNKPNKNKPKNFVLTGFFLRNYKNYEKLLKDFHDFIKENSDLFFWNYELELSNKKKQLIHCDCQKNTPIYKCLHNNDFKDLFKTPKIQNEILYYGKNKEKQLTPEHKRLIQEFLDKKIDYVEKFFIEFTEEDLKNEKDLFYREDKSPDYKWYGKKDTPIIRNLLLYIMICSGVLFNRFKRIEIIHDRRQDWKPEFQQRETSWFLKFSAGIFDNFFKLLSESSNPNRTDCFTPILRYTLNLNNPHKKLPQLMRDMWYFDINNIFNIDFISNQYNSEFLVIADWIGKFHEKPFVIDLSYKELTKFIFRQMDLVYDWFKKGLCKKTIQHQHKFGGCDLKNCDGCFENKDKTCNGVCDECIAKI